MTDRVLLTVPLGSEINRWFDIVAGERGAPPAYLRLNEKGSEPFLAATRSVWIFAPFLM